MRSTDELRQAFLDFFAGKDHRILPSTSLIPDDPSTLFTSAGMQPFVPYFLGTEQPPHPRLSTCQKCLRADDVEDVGHTARHLTFFEMLGNFSFGDYFKKEAIEWAWECVTQVYGFPKEEIWISVYQEDEEAWEVWHRHIGIPAERIVRLGKKTNWWGPVGRTGPCGPCSEIFIDRGPSFGEERAPGGESDRFAELWNLVFQSYDQQEDGSLIPLERPGIDTGMGLERLACLMQGVPTLFDTDIFQPILQRIVAIAREQGLSVAYGLRKEVDVALKIIADHTRAVAFAIGDDARPSNEGRGYVLRRLLRRAYRFGRTLGVQGPFLYRLVEPIALAMRQPYPELEAKRSVIEQVLRFEEERFEATLSQGLQLLAEAIEEAKARGVSVLPGEVVFRLYDTYGFPKELTLEIAQEQGLGVDEAHFEALMEEQRRRARQAWVEVAHGEWAEAAEAYRDLPMARFRGYETTECEGTIVGLLMDGRRVEALAEGQEGEVVLDETPFYAEAGGQVGDIGTLEGPTGQAQVLDTYKAPTANILHRVQVQRGTLRVGDRVVARVDSVRRQAIRRAHTATHLLHAALRRILGPHVAQAGSLVEPDRLRFDFSHFRALSLEEIHRIEQFIQEVIVQNLPVTWDYHPLQEAKQMGAMALFGEKYGERVRVVKVPGVSLELCGGTHVERTGDIGLCKILSEGSIAAGVRRIDAYTGPLALQALQEQERHLRAVGEALNVAPSEAPERLQALLQRLKEAESEIRDLRRGKVTVQVETLLQEAQWVNGAQMVVHRVDGVDEDTLRALVDQVVERLGNGVVLLGSVTPRGRVVFFCKVAESLTQRGLHAGELVQEVAQVVGGGGGGRPTFAQAGGRDASRLEEALRHGEAWIRSRLHAGAGP